MRYRRVAPTGFQLPAARVRSDITTTGQVVPRFSKPGAVPFLPRPSGRRGASTAKGRGGRRPPRCPSISERRAVMPRFVLLNPMLHHAGQDLLAARGDVEIV